jgi:DNA-binding NtrC family response regulator
MRKGEVKIMGLKVAYVDDEVDLCEIFLDTFQDETISITTYSNPNLALEGIQTNPPDLIFLDYRLPKTTGDQLALKINNSVPKCLISGDLFIKTEYKFLKVFQKPFKYEEIRALLDEFVAKKNL